MLSTGEKGHGCGRVFGGVRGGEFGEEEVKREGEREVGKKCRVFI